VLRIVAERGPQPFDRRVQSGIERDERVRRPQALVQFLARDDFAGPIEECQEHLERLALNANAPPLFSELARAHIELERAEPSHHASHSAMPSRFF
jgi:hypothetical protein